MAEHPRLYDPILVALDGSRRAEHVVPYVAALPASTRSRVILLRAVDAPSTAFTSPADSLQFAKQERRHASEYLARVRPRLHARGIATTTEALVGTAADIIVGRAAEMGACPDCDQYAWTGWPGSAALRQRCHSRGADWAVGELARVLRERGVDARHEALGGDARRAPCPVLIADAHPAPVT